MLEKKIFWIASYPKSGNTWMRSIISSLFYTNDGNFDFSILKNIELIDIPKNYNFVKNVDFNNINEISKHRIKAQEYFIQKNKNLKFYKTHSANLKIQNFDYTNPSTSLGLIYLVRDPRDIVVSMSHHQNNSINEIIDIIINKEAVVFAPLKKYMDPNFPYLIPSHISSWEQNYLSWQLLDVPKLTIDYNNLLMDTENIIKLIIDFFEKNYNFVFDNKKNIIKNIILSTNFKKLQKKELEYGFAESLESNFFRSGKSNQWKFVLSNKQQLKIENEFHNTMKKLGYI